MNKTRRGLSKMGMAVTTSLVCAAGLPVLVMMAVGSFRGFAFAPEEPMAWLGSMFLLTIASFWYACAVNGTWPAVAWVFPAMGTVYLAGECGKWVALQLVHTPGLLMEYAVHGPHLDPIPFLGVPDIGPGLLLIVPPSVFAVRQSYRMFRTQPHDRMLGIVRSLLALAFVVFLFSFLGWAYGIRIYY
jgi:hypothetical protein